MAVAGIHGQLLEITVVGCNRLRDTEWFSRQDPYVSVEYGNSKFRTRTCTDGGKNPSFQEKFTITLIEGLREIMLVVWNSNTITMDDLIGSGKIQLQKVLAEGYDDSTWPLQGRNGAFSGDVRVIMHTQRSSYYGPPAGYPPPGVPPPPATCAYPFTQAPPLPAYPPTSVWPPPPQPQPAAAYLLPQASTYPQAPYPPQTYPPPTYPPGQYPGVYPPPPPY